MKFFNNKLKKIIFYRIISIIYKKYSNPYWIFFLVLKFFKCIVLEFFSQTRNIWHVIEYFLRDLYKNFKTYIG